MQLGPHPLAQSQSSDDKSIDETTIQLLDAEIEQVQRKQAQNQQDSLPKQQLSDEQRAKKRAYDRERQKKCFNKKRKTIADSLMQSNECITHYAAFADNVASNISAKDKAYNQYLEMVAKVQAFAKENVSNNSYIQKCLSEMPCNMSEMQRQELIKRINTVPFVPAFSSQQLGASLDKGTSKDAIKKENTENHVLASTFK